MLYILLLEIISSIYPAKITQNLRSHHYICLPVVYHPQKYEKKMVTKMEDRQHLPQKCLIHNNGKK